MNEPTPNQWQRFNKHHIREELIPESKSLMDMSKDELDESWKQYQQLVELDEKEKEQ